MISFPAIFRIAATLVYRVAIRRSQSKGLAIVEYKPLDDKANEEINSLYKEVFND